eukprot:IDg6789t1
MARTRTWRSASQWRRFQGYVQRKIEKKLKQQAGARVHALLSPVCYNCIGSVQNHDANMKGAFFRETGGATAAFQAGEARREIRAGQCCVRTLRARRGGVDRCENFGAAAACGSSMSAARISGRHLGAQCGIECIAASVWRCDFNQPRAFRNPPISFHNTVTGAAAQPRRGISAGICGASTGPAQVMGARAAVYRTQWEGSATRKDSKYAAKNRNAVIYWAAAGNASWYAYGRAGRMRCGRKRGGAACLSHRSKAGAVGPPIAARVPAGGSARPKLSASAAGRDGG